MNLAEMQTLFWMAMRDPPSAANDVDATFCSDERLSAGARIAIYRGMYFTRQIEALRQDFPRLERQLGQGAFRLVCRDYLLSHPSEDPRLEWLGQRMVGFLRGHADANLAAYADLAAFEWAEVEALIAEDPSTLFQRFDVPVGRFPRARLTFVPSCRLLHLRTDPVPGSAGPVSPARFIVWRKGFAVLHARPEADEFDAACVAQAGATLAEVCARFGEAPDPARRASSALAAWISRGLVSRIVSDEAGDS